MDHGGMDHGGMDHGGMGHGGMEMPSDACKMSMIWSWTVPTDNTCVVFPSWKIRTRSDFVLSMIAIILLGTLYEWLRLYIRSADARLVDTYGARQPHRRRASVLPTSASRTDSSSSSDVSIGIGAGSESRELLGRKGSKRVATGGFVGIPPLPIPRRSQVRRSIVYGASIFLSFFLMLVFMTYNVYLIGAVVTGAIFGHYLFNRDLAQQSKLSILGDRGAACH